MPITLISQKNTTGLWEAGDAGLIIKPDGTFAIINSFDADPAKMTPEQAETIKKLRALCVPLRLPQVMDMLEGVANDERVFDQTAVVDSGDTPRH